jgi:hypothetical protein
MPNAASPPGPLSTIARWKSPRASGDAISRYADIAPADWPAIVTVRGSPPNAAMLSRTQPNAAT